MTELKRVTFQNSRGKTLVGHLFSTPGEAIVVMAPGFCSDKSSQGRFDVYARRLNEKGISALAIDFAGCGESDDDALTLDKQVDDFQAAIQFVQSLGYQKIGLFGNSLGGLVCLKVYSPLIKTIAMTGGLTGPYILDWKKHFNQKQVQDLQEKRCFTESNATHMHRSEIVIDQQMLHDFETVDQKQVLSSVKCPVFMIHGDTGEEEILLRTLSQAGIAYLPPTSELKIIPGAGHLFWGHVDQVAKMLTEWFTRYL